MATTGAPPPTGNVFGVVSNSFLFSVTLAILAGFLAKGTGPRRLRMIVPVLTVGGSTPKLTSGLGLLTELQQLIRPLPLVGMLMAAPVPGSSSTTVGSTSGARTASGRPVRKRRDPLRHHRAVVGLDARVRWWERVRAAVILLVMVVALGALLAIFVAFLIFLGTVLLEILAG